MQFVQDRIFYVSFYEKTVFGTTKLNGVIKTSEIFSFLPQINNLEITCAIFKFEDSLLYN